MLTVHEPAFATTALVHVGAIQMGNNVATAVSGAGLLAGPLTPIEIDEAQIL